jgi:hypothetical protein
MRYGERDIVIRGVEARTSREMARGRSLQRTTLRPTDQKMKFIEPRPFANPDAAAYKLIELARAFEPMPANRRAAPSRVEPKAIGMALATRLSWLLMRV